MNNPSGTPPVSPELLGRHPKWEPELGLLLSRGVPEDLLKDCPTELVASWHYFLKELPEEFKPHIHYARHAGRWLCRIGEVVFDMANLTAAENQPEEGVWLIDRDSYFSSDAASGAPKPPGARLPSIQDLKNALQVFDSANENKASQYLRRVLPMRRFSYCDRDGRVDTADCENTWFYWLANGDSMRVHNNTHCFQPGDICPDHGYMVRCVVDPGGEIEWIQPGIESDIPKLTKLVSEKIPA